MSEGKKHDQGKTRLDLIPVEAVEALGKVLTMGAKKYTPHNWRQGIDYSRIYSAVQRHLQAFWGEAPDMDEESKLSHLSHAFCGLAFLITYEENKERYRTFDDRGGSNNGYYKEREELVSSITKLVRDNPSFFECKIGDNTLQKVYDTLDYTIHSPYTIVKEKQIFPDLTKMTHREAYKQLEVGMKVRVLRSASAGERGWPVEWVNPMDKYIGEEVLIERLHDHAGVVLRYGKHGSTWNFPAFVLEIISNPEPEEGPVFPDLTKMTHPEACEYLEVGMKVKVLFKGESHVRGWRNCWCNMDEAIGNEFIVEVIEKCGVRFKDPGFWQGFPAFVLEIISRPEDTK